MIHDVTLMIAEARHATAVLNDLPGRVRRAADMAIGAAQVAVRALAGSSGITLAPHVMCGRVHDDRLWVATPAVTLMTM